MSGSHTVFLERRHRGETDDERRAVTVSTPERRRGQRGKPELVLQITGADQDAMEFLNREQFEELVTAARQIMGWEPTRSELGSELKIAAEEVEGWLDWAAKHHPAHPALIKVQADLVQRWRKLADSTIPSK